jgi:hypothetical protein
MVETLFDRLFPRRAPEERAPPLDALLEENGFDARSTSRSAPTCAAAASGWRRTGCRERHHRGRAARRTCGCAATGSANCVPGEEALRNGEVAVVTLAAGAGSRWTRARAWSRPCTRSASAGRHTAASSKCIWPRARRGRPRRRHVPHIFTTSYLTHAPVRAYSSCSSNYGYGGPLILSPGRAIGLRMIPMERDLRFAWEEMPQQRSTSRRRRCATACAPR